MQKILSLFLVGGLLLVLGAPGVSALPQMQSGDQIYITENLPDDSYVAGGNVVIDGNVDGDLIVAGGMIKVNGDIKGDLIVAGGNISVKGNVADDVRIAGGNIDISGSIGDDLFVGGGSIVIGNDTSIGGTATVAGGLVQISGLVKENLLLAGGSILLGARVAGNVQVEPEEDFKVLPGAEVTGNFKYIGPQEPVMDKSFIKGKYEYQKSDFPGSEQVAAWLSAGLLWGLLFSLVSTLVLGIVFILFSRYTLSNVSQEVHQKPMRSLGYGFVTFLVLVFGVLLCFATLIGFKLALLLLWILLAFFTIISVFNAYFLAHWLMRGKENSTGKTILFFILGVLIYQIISAIPVFGWLFAMILSLMNLGAIYQTRKEIFEKLRKSKLA